MTAFLSHLRIVEGSAFVAAPFAGMSLAQMGAEVIRFDLPGGGIDYRRMPRDPAGGASFYWAGLNKGKKSVCVDFRRAEGRELIEALIAAPGEGGGFLLTNFAGLPWLAHDRLAARRPDLISLTISGNPDGSSEVDYTVNAATGLPALTGPGGAEQPVNHVLPAWDLACGHQAALALLAAYVDRLRTGTGKQMTLALSDVAFAILGHLGMIGEAERRQARPAGGNDLFGGFGRDFPTADGRRVMVVALTARQWSALQKATGIEAAVGRLQAELGADLSEEETRYRHRDAIAALVGPWIAERRLAEVAAAFDARGVCWGPYRTIQDFLANDPRGSDANPLWAHVEHAGIGAIRTPGLAVSVVGSARVTPGSAPALGQHTEQVLTETLGLPGHAIAALIDRGIVAVAA